VLPGQDVAAAARAGSSRVFLPRSPEINTAEAALRWSLVAFVSGQLPFVTLSEAGGAISAKVSMAEDNFTVHRHWPSDFLIRCSSRCVRDAVAAAGVVDGRGFTLRFSPWNRQLQAVRVDMGARLHLEMTGVPAHACNKTTAATVLGSAAWVERLGETSVSREDLGRLQVVAWTDDVQLLPLARELLIEEPDDLLEEDDGLVLPGEALIPLGKSMLWYLISICLVRSESVLDGRRAPGPGGDGLDGDGGGNQRHARRDGDPRFRDGRADAGWRRGRDSGGGSQRDDRDGGRRRGGSPERHGRRRGGLADGPLCALAHLPVAKEIEEGEIMEGPGGARACADDDPLIGLSGDRDFFDQGQNR
jgi:hypothetical protein